VVATASAGSATPTGPVLAIFAHPDDAEICAGGVLTKWAAAGREVHLLVLTNGDRGSGDPARDRVELARVRRAETEAGARVLGLASAQVLGVHDGELENSVTVREAVVRRIRETRAETVVSCDPTAVFFQIPIADTNDTRTAYNHSDHRTAGAVALDAVFPGSGNPHFFPEHLDEGLGIQEIRGVWLGWTNEPNLVEEVSGHFDTKIAALAEHASQITEGIRLWDEWMREEARAAGGRVGVDLAEEFRVLDLG
jgi:LmbE family N-acetylglucosaminyl deacetylase